MEQDEKDKLLAYAIKMLERGDHFSDIILYIDRKGADSELQKKIILKLEAHKKTLTNKEKKLYPVSGAKIIFGTLFFILTLYLMYFNIISFPWTILGFIAVAGALFEIVKIVLNLFKK
ncbi:MAG: hypothetical protein LBT50_06965 [Prevotellaceae bacterium]|jgi:hypothetical protein|nr:hypothetical protein [Prevotellaceae bacterium]